MSQDALKQKIEEMEQQQAESLQIKQAALQKMNEADAMIQRQQGYLIALRELLQSPDNNKLDPNEAPEPEEVEI